MTQPTDATDADLCACWSDLPTPGKIAVRIWIWAAILFGILMVTIPGSPLKYDGADAFAVWIFLTFAFSISPLIGLFVLAIGAGILWIFWFLVGFPGYAMFGACKGNCEEGATQNNGQPLGDLEQGRMSQSECDTFVGGTEDDEKSES